MVTNGINSPQTSSAGRLFDAVAALIGIRHHVTFEGQAAMELECAIEPGVDECYDFELTASESAVPAHACSSLTFDWKPVIHSILQDLQHGLPLSVIAARFHNTLVEAIIAIARHIGENKVLLTGGCFQNKYLLERTIRRLQEERFHPFWHHRIPPNDGGIAPGQIMGALRVQSREHGIVSNGKEENVSGHSR
jgi:hydrogenase maturation protein HypF